MKGESGRGKGGGGVTGCRSGGKGWHVDVNVDAVGAGRWLHMQMEWRGKKRFGNDEYSGRQRAWTRRCYDPSDHVRHFPGSMLACKEPTENGLVGVELHAISAGQCEACAERL